MKLTAFFIGSCKVKPTTGGHIYNQKIVESLKEIGINIIMVNVHELPGFFKIKFFSFIYSFLKFFQFPPSFIIQVVDSSLRYFPFSILITILRIPTIQIVHHLKEELPGFRIQDFLNSQLMKFNLSNANLIIVNSENTKQHVLRYTNGKIKGRVEIVNPGVDYKIKFSRSRMYKDTKRWNIITVGSIIPRKGYENLIEPIKNLKSYINKVYIVGKIENKKYFDYLVRKIRELGLEGKFEFTGYVARELLCELYIKSELFVSTSLHEGYGMAISEALLHGLPVVATAAGAISELIQHEKTGLLVEPSNPKALEDALKKLFMHPEFADEISQNIRIWCKGLKDWDEVKKSLENLFLDFIKNNIPQFKY
jgi:glycosyltransferase involved in cell wall biosynthesis